MSVLASQMTRREPVFSPPLQSVEFFSGAGGLAIGCHIAGFSHRALIEWNGDACNTIRANVISNAIPGINSWRLIQGDARQIDLTNFRGVDLIAGGPPCQPFSIAGKARGMEDLRDMIPLFVRAVRTIVPRAFVMENVKGLTRPVFREYLDYAILQLSHPTLSRHDGESIDDHRGRLDDARGHNHTLDVNYRVDYRILNAADYGVPQTRERVFIVGIRSDQKVEWSFPEPTHSRHALLYDQQVTGEYWVRHHLGCPDSNMRVSSVPLDFLRIVDRVLLPWQTLRDAIADLPTPVIGADTGGFYNHRLNPGARTYPGHTGSLLDLPSKTLKAGDHGVPGGENMIAFSDGSVRYMTVREAARVQTFPDTWTFTGPWSEAMRQLGNAVPVRLASVVTASVAQALEKANA